MRTKLTSADLPLIIICLVGSILLLLILANFFGKSAKRCDRADVKIVNMPFIILYALPITILGICTGIFEIKITGTLKIIYIIVCAVAVLIPTIYNISKIGISGLLISFLQALCGLVLGAFVYASVAVVIIIVAVGFIGGLGGSKSGEKILRSVTGSDVVHVYYWSDGCWKDGSGNCYYEYSGGNRWYDDYGREYIE